MLLCGIALIFLQGVTLVNGRYRTLDECNLNRPYQPFHDAKLEQVMVQLFDCEQRSDHYFNWNRVAKRDSNCGSPTAIFSTGMGEFLRECEDNNEINFACFAHDKCFEDGVLSKAECNQYFRESLNHITRNKFFCRGMVNVAASFVEHATVG